MSSSTFIVLCCLLASPVIVEAKRRETKRQILQPNAFRIEGSANDHQNQGPEDSNADEHSSAKVETTAILEQQASNEGMASHEAWPAASQQNVEVSFWDCVFHISFAIAAIIWFVQSCSCLKCGVSVGAMSVFICASLLTVLGARLRSLNIGQYILLAFPGLALFKWMLHWYHGEALHQYASNGVKEQLAIGLLLTMLGDRRWVFDANWDHPSDPLVPFTSDLMMLRMLQQCFFVVIWICLIFLVLECTKPASSAQASGSSMNEDDSLHPSKWAKGFLPFAPLTGVVVAMPFLYISDLMMWCMTVLVTFFGLAALLLKDRDRDFPAQTAMRTMLSFIYIFSGLNKCNKPVMENGDVFFHQTLQRYVPGLDYYTHTPSVMLSMGMMIVCIQVSSGLLLLLGRGWCQKLAAVVLCMMHGLLVFTWCFSPSWLGGWVTPPNFAFPMICMTVFVSWDSPASLVTSDRTQSKKFQLADHYLKKHWGTKCSWILYICTFALFFIVGPTLYFIPSRPLWPNNGQMSFAMWGNVPRYSIEVSSSAGPATQENEMTLWRYVRYGSFDRDAFYKKRFTIAGSDLWGFMFDSSERSQLKQAEWISKQLGVDVTLKVESKAQFGHVEPHYTSYEYKCNPACFHNSIQ